MEKILNQFIDEFKSKSYKEKIEIIGSESCSFIQKLKSYCEDSSSFSDLVSEISIIEKELLIIAENNILPNTSEDVNERIKYLKNDILELLLTGECTDRYSFTQDQLEILDEFFERTSGAIIEKVLINVRDRLTVQNKYSKFRKNRFTISTLVVMFPDVHHDSSVLHYLEDKYRTRFNELGLDELGLVDFTITTAGRVKKNENLKINYSNPDVYNKKKYGCYNYDLNVSYSLVKREVLENSFCNNKEQEKTKSYRFK